MPLSAVMPAALVVLGFVAAIVVAARRGQTGIAFGLGGIVDGDGYGKPLRLLEMAWRRV